LLGSGLISPTSVVAVVPAATFLVIGYLFVRLRRNFVAPLAVEWGLVRPTLRYAVRAYFAALAGFIVLRSDILMVKYIVGSDAVGHYSIAVSVVDMMQLFPVVVGSLLFPRLSAMRDRTEQWNLAKRVALLIALTIGVSAILLGALANILIVLLFGRDFLPSVPPLLWLLPGIFMLSVNTIFMNYFAARGMPLVTTVISPTLAAVLNIILNLYLIPLLGITGAALSSTVCYGMMLLFSIVYIPIEGRRATSQYAGPKRQNS
jgi:O-antigen/teichoic acid export membrane protein